MPECLGYTHISESYSWQRRVNCGLMLVSLCAIAAAYTGVADRLFKRHGQWWSESAKDDYVC